MEITQNMIFILMELGFCGERKGFNTLMDRIRERKYDVLVVPDANRIYRVKYNIQTLIKLVNEIDSYGVETFVASRGKIPLSEYLIPFALRSWIQ